MNTITFEQLPKAVGELLERMANIENLLLTKKEQPSKSENDKLLTVEQTAEFLNLSIPTIYSKVSKGELPNMKRGKRLYFSQKELLEYLKQGKRKTHEEIALEAEKYFNKQKKG